MLASDAGDEVVDADDLVAACQEALAEVRADEARAAGDDRSHVRSLLMVSRDRGDRRVATVVSRPHAVTGKLAKPRLQLRPVTLCWQAGESGLQFRAEYRYR